MVKTDEKKGAEKTGKNETNLVLMAKQQASLSDA